jgi:two-component system chemotaxis response regulator CheY
MKGIITTMGNILIVDDSSLIRGVASSATQEAGHTPIVATNGQEGLDAIKTNKIDLIFSDVNMPVMGGIEMVTQIKDNPDHRFIPVIMLTTESDPILKEQGKALGVKAWMLKPFNKEKFFMAVKKLLR